MKWFKHVSDSLDDPFIFDLIDTYGGDGYLVFFGTLEVMSREFDVNNPGNCQVSVKFLTKKLQLSTKLVTKVLQFCAENNRIYYTINKDTISLNCPKLIKMCDEFTNKVLKAKSGVNPDPIGSESGTEVRSKKKEEDNINNLNNNPNGDSKKEEEKKPEEDEKKPEKKEKKKSTSAVKFDPEKKVFFDIPEEIMKKWREVAPGINIPDEIKKAELWIISNPDKGRSQWTAFLSKWMVRAQATYIKYGGGNGSNRQNDTRGQREAVGKTQSDGAPYPVDAVCTE